MVVTNLQILRDNRPWLSLIRRFYETISHGCSGKGASPSSTCTTCLMLGRASGAELEQASPRRNTASISPLSYIPLNLQSPAITICPFAWHSHTHSTNTISSGGALASIGLRPQATSKRRAP
ncbi:hypothetical protein AMTRI_Chr08g203450 [Amborella trichopoda]